MKLIKLLTNKHNQITMYYLMFISSSEKVTHHNNHLMHDVLSVGNCFFILILHKPITILLTNKIIYTVLLNIQ